MMKNIRYSLVALLGALAACTYSPLQSPSFEPAPFFSERYGVKANQVVSKALSLTGTPYRNNGGSPKTGFDCSGLVAYVYQSVGLNLPRMTSKLMNMPAPKVTRSELRAGDLLYFATQKYSRSVSHVGIYIGEGVFIHAPSSGKSVSRASLSSPYWQASYLGANRPLAQHLNQ